MKLQGSQLKDASDSVLGECDTLLLDMDGTLLDLHFDNHVWLEVVPVEFARQNSMPEQDAREQLYKKMMALRGTLNWYCLEFWSDELDLDIVGLHRTMNHKITYLPGAEKFLQTVASSEMRVLLTTNSHQTTLDMKDEVTGLTRHFDEIYTCHDLGSPKEEQGYWNKLMEAEDFDPERTLFVDDNPHVLASARKFGIEHLVAIEAPDSNRPAKSFDEYHSVEGVAKLTEL